MNATRAAAAYVGVYGMGRSLVSLAAGGTGPFGESDPIGAVLADGERRKEVDAILADCRERVRRLLLAKRHVVEGVRDALLEREELIGDEIEVLMAELGEREPLELPELAVPEGNGQREVPVALGPGVDGVGGGGPAPPGSAQAPPRPDRP